ncbi:primase [Pantoea phage vB_PagS_Vid5]|uniref:Primase n=1 Tax=Pantoea phage vB_PagS_Vid5 TaxID=2099652 RepID=A0A2P1CKP7_9CAUD|nr:DNA primase [Pantoea phage vB_PagS_Vid5]AVJ51816.1 primase [Pantoea phage vB_PagS_Vid5]
MDKFPEEIKAYPHWALAGDDKRPLVWDGTKGKLVDVSVHDVQKLMTFENALAAAKYYNKYMGFILHESDPFACIDLDVKDAENEPDVRKHTSPEQLRRFESIIAAFNTYSELSRSGKGVHLWVKGAIGKGCKRDGVEVYSQERFIICTGRVMQQLPVQNEQVMLGSLVGEIRSGQKSSAIELVEIEPVEEDFELHIRAQDADNADKYNALCNGDWAGMGYPSQSEADLALMSMLAFYSKSNEQCRRMFRMTGLGKREKANKNNRHLDYMLRLIRARQEREALSQADMEAVAKQFVMQLNNAQGALSDAIAHPVETPAQGTVSEAPVTAPGKMGKAERIDWPPGLAGELSKYIYYSSVRPVKEISIITALGFLAGVCGKAWHIPQSGLNMYAVLVARSGVGKETMNSGLSYITTTLRESIPSVDSFVSFDKHSSGPALRKSFADRQSYINLNGELGKIIKNMATDRPGGPMSSLRHDLTDIYQKSGPSSIVGGMTYSNKDENTKSVTGVAYSLMGESTPETFFESLTREMMEDGFLSRFLVIRYEGDRPKYNKNASTQMSKELRDALCNLVTQSLTLISRFQNVEVPFSPEAEAICDAFNDECDDAINASKDEAVRQPWNRAHLKVLRLAALLAVSDNWVTPVVQHWHVAYALTVVRHGMNIMFEEWEKGGIGIDDNTRMRRVVSVTLNYFKGTSMVVNRGLIEKGIITRTDIHRRVAAKAAFKNHKGGTNMAIDQTIRSLCDLGVFKELLPTKCQELGYNGKAYYVTEQINTLFDGEGEE